MCRALGCLLQSCQLCKHNPSRRCAVNFDKKYLVNDVLKAKCQAVIRVEIVERNSNQPIEVSDLREDMVLQMAILDGNSYDGKFEAGLESDFESCLLLMNNKVRARVCCSSPLMFSFLFPPPPPPPPCSAFLFLLRIPKRLTSEG